MKPAEGALPCILEAWRSHEPELHGFLARRVPDPQLADDLLQDVFLKALKQGRDFCGIAQPRAWLFRVARNAMIDHARLARPEVSLPEDLEHEAAEEAPPVDRLAGCLARVLGELPAEDAEILRACDLEGMRQKDFAQSRRLSLPAAKSRLLRARARLRATLAANCRVGFDESGRVCCHRPRDPS